MNRLLGVIAVLVFAFLHVPLFVLVLFSVNAARFTLWQGFSWQWYRAAFQDAQLLEASANSLVIAVISTLAATAIGTLGAYALWKQNARWLTGSLYVSLVTPEIVLGVSLLAFFQFIFRVLPIRLGLHTVILAHISFSLAYVVTVVLARLRTLDATLEEAALDLGATPWRAFWEVTLPLIKPGVLAAALLAFTISFDDYVITSLVAGVDSETLPMVIYAMAKRGANPVLNAISSVMLVGLGALVLLAERLRTA